jgi:hypothetical protein
VLLGQGLPEWRRGLGFAGLALLPVLHVLPNDGGQWYLLLPSVGAALAWGAIADAEPRWRRWVVLLVAITALASLGESFAWRRASLDVDRTVDLVRDGLWQEPTRQDPRNWPHRGPSFCCGVPYQVLEAPEPGWGPITEGP